MSDADTTELDTESQAAGPTTASLPQDGTMEPAATGSIAAETSEMGDLGGAPDLDDPADVATDGTASVGRSPATSTAGLPGSEGAGTASAKKPKAAAGPKRRTTSKAPAASPVAVDSLVESLSSLAGSVASLSGTVESLSDKVRSSDRLIQIVDELPSTLAKVGVVTPEVAAEVAAAEVAAAAETERDAPLLKVAAHHLSTFATFAGVALVGAAAMRPHLTDGALIMAIVGLLAFTVASLFENGDRPSGSIPDLATRAGGSALLVAGAGLATGGIQYFDATPHRAAKLIPLGLALFTVGFVLRSGYRLAREHLVWMAGAGVWICLILTLGLGKAADAKAPSHKVHTPPTPTTVAAHPPTTLVHGAASDVHGGAESKATESTTTSLAAHGPTDEGSMATHGAATAPTTTGPTTTVSTGSSTGVTHEAGTTGTSAHE